MVSQKCTLKLYTYTLEAHLNLLKTNDKTNKISNKFGYNEFFGIKNYYYLRFNQINCLYTVVYRPLKIVYSPYKVFILSSHSPGTL